MRLASCRMAILAIPILLSSIGMVDARVISGQETISSEITDNLALDDGAELIINDGGFVSGNVQNNPITSATTGAVTINTNYNTNNGTNITNFGASDSLLKQITVNGGSRFTISNPAYINEIAINSGTIELNSNDVVIKTITNASSSSPSNTVIINTNYFGDTQFGKNLSSTSFFDIKITQNNSLTITNKDAYVHNLELSNSSTLNLNDSQFYGRISSVANGLGTVNINFSDGTSYGSNATRFGTSDNSIGVVNINSNNGIFKLSNTAYINNLNLGNNTNLLLSNGANFYGTINGDANNTVIISDNFDYNGYNTKFGTADSSIGKLTIGNSSSLTLANEVYIDNIELSQNTSTLTLGNGSLIHGTVNGSNNNTGTVVIDATSYDSKNTHFGTATNSINLLRIEDESQLLLFNDAYATYIQLGGQNSTLAFTGGGFHKGVISSATSGTGEIIITRDYSTSTNSEYFYNTRFGTMNNAIGTIKINSNASFTLGNHAYVDNLRLQSNSTLNLNQDSGAIGTTISGAGIVNINADYKTGVLDVNNSVFDTKFGDPSTALLNQLNIGFNTTADTVENIVTLTLGNDAYVNNLLISNSSTLNIENSYGVAGIIAGMENNQGNVILNGDYDTSTLGTIFGAADHALGNVSLTNSSLKLTNAANISSLNFTINNDDTLKKILTMTENSYFNGAININSRPGDKVIGATLDESMISDLYSLIATVNAASPAAAGVQAGNELFLSVINQNLINEGDRLTLDTGKDNYTNAAMVYDGIFLKLELDKSIANRLDLVFIENRTPTLNDVSEATLTAAGVIDSWFGARKTMDQYSLTYALQSIENKNDFFHALTNLTPDVSGANIKMPAQSLTSALANINRRLNFLRLNKFSDKERTVISRLIKDYSPKYYDDYVKKRNFWWEAFAGNYTQDTKERVYGYDATYYGATLGYDIRSSSNFVFGMSYTFNNINADDKDIIKKDRDNIKAMTHNLDLYAMVYNKYNYLSFNAGGGYNIYEQERNINFSNFNKVAKSKYNGISYYGAVEYGVNIVIYSSENKRNSNNNNLNDINRQLNARSINNNNNYNNNNYNNNNNNYNNSYYEDNIDYNDNTGGYYDNYGYYNDNYNRINNNSNNNYNNNSNNNNNYNSNNRNNNNYNNRNNNNNYNNINNTKKRKKKSKLSDKVLGPIHNFIMLTPKISISYNNIMIDDYTEKGADAANLVIKTKDYSSLDANAGLNLTFNKGISENTSFQTVLKGDVTYAIINNRVELNARYIDTTQDFKVYGIEPNDLTYSAGINLSFNFYDKLDIGLGYDYIFGDGVRGNLLKLTLLYAF